MPKRKSPPLSRRRFLERASAVFGAATLGAACGSDENQNASPTAGGRDGSASPPDGPSPSDASVSRRDASTPPGLVAVVGQLDVDAAVARAVELAGGIDEIQPGQTVFIKPNAVSDRMPSALGIRTSPAVLAAVVRLVKAKNPGRIIVGDRSARSFPDTTRIFEVTGLAAAALAAGADEIFPAPSPAQNPDEWVLVQPPLYQETWGAAGGILAMRRILEADHFINVPACKDHRLAVFSLSMKNLIGAIGDSSRNPLHWQQFPFIGRDIAVLNQIFRPLINVLDATTALVNGGPEGDGTDAVRTSPGLILASRDRVALDATGVSLIKLELSRTSVPQPDPMHLLLMQTPAWGLPQIEQGIAHGLGVASSAAVTLLFEEVKDAAAIEAILREPPQTG